MINYDLIRTSSLNNTFKNTGVFTTSVTLSGAVANGAFGTFDTTLTLTQPPIYSETLANFTEFVSGTSGWWDTKQNGRITTSAGTTNFWIILIINGNNVTFRAQVFNSTASPFTLSTTTVNIQYVTYTLAR
jgi:hypothetical protein